MLSWSSIGVNWLRVGVLVNIYNWVVVVRIVGMMRISSWVGIDSLIIVMDGLVVDWLYFVRSVVLKIMTDSLMWCMHIVFSHMVVMMVTDVVSIVSMVIMIVVNILKLNFVGIFTIVISLMVNFMLSLMINKFVSNIVVLSLTTLYNWLNLVNRSLLERSMV